MTADALVAAPLTPSLNFQHGVQVGDLHLERSILGEWRRRRRDLGPWHGLRWRPQIVEPWERPPRDPEALVRPQSVAHAREGHERGLVFLRQEATKSSRGRFLRQEATKSSRDRFLRHGGAPTNNWFVAIGVPII